MSKKEEKAPNKRDTYIIYEDNDNIIIKDEDVRVEYNHISFEEEMNRQELEEAYHQSVFDKRYSLYRDLEEYVRNNGLNMLEYNNFTIFNQLLDLTY